MVKWLVFITLSLNLIGLGGCASHQGPDASVPDAPTSQEPSFEALRQGIEYIREHPVDREEDRVQRFLWLDQWIRVLQERSRLTPEMGREFWDDLVSFTSNPDLGINGIERLHKRVQSKLGKNLVLFQRYQLMLRDQSLENAMENLRGIEDDQVSDYFARAQQLLQIDQVAEVSESRKIGVLIPLSGELSVFGKQVLESVQVAADLAYAEGIEFVIRDTGVTDEQLSQALNELVQDEKVTAILGPLTTKETEFVFERAELLAVPVLSLAPKESIRVFGSHGIRSTLTIEDQLIRLADFLSQEMKAKRIAIMSPDTTYGWDVVNLAPQIFEDRGLKVTQMQVYPENATDFKDPLKRMTRLDFPKLREAEVCPKNAPKDQLPKYCVPKLKDLRPLIDFEVLLVPDFAPTVGYLLPTLPFLRINGVQVVGLSGLNSTQLIERAGASAEGVIFTDGYLSSSDDYQTRFFQTRYRRLSEGSISRLAAEAFDAATLLVDTMRKFQGAVDRARFLERLRETSQFPGVTGSIWFENNRFRKRPRLIAVRDGLFKELSDFRATK